VPPHIDLGVGVSKKMAREAKRFGSGGDAKRAKKTKIFRQVGPGLKNKGGVQFSR
jgi:hypothetical protein